MVNPLHSALFAGQSVVKEERYWAGPFVGVPISRTLLGECGTFINEDFYLEAWASPSFAFNTILFPVIDGMPPWLTYC